jgi:hypothetical protein
MTPPATFHLPISTLVFGTLGLMALVLGILAMAGLLHEVHPLLNSEGGLALIVSGIALLLSGAFPLALAWLAAGQHSAE